MLPNTSEPEWRGLTEAEAAERLAKDGPNALAVREERGLLVLVLEVAREPMVLLLLSAAGLYGAVGDLHGALTLLASVVVVLAITVFQEGRTERSLAALRDLASPRAQVLRERRTRTIPARELVHGDVIRIAEGDRVPADGVLRAGTVLTVDESLLSGESAPVTKMPSATDALSAPNADTSSSLFSGTLVTSGRGVVEVMATGPRSELGRIGVSLKSVEAGRSPLQREVDALVRRIAVLALALAALVGIARVSSGRPWVDSLLSALTVAIALIPEEFPVVLTVFLALGAWRISKHRVLTRRVAVLETLGAADVLCTDKTGTLTQNRMAIRRLRTAGGTFTVEASGSSLPEEMHALVEYGVLACPRDPFDPMEKAFLEIGDRSLRGTEHLHPKWNAVREYPLTAGLLAVTHVWDAPEKPSLTVATKGAPEAVFDLCHLSIEDTERWRSRVTELAKDGLRVLGVARSVGLVRVSPEQAHDVDFEMVGLVGLEDPLRPDIVEAVSACRRAGIRVVMITGDHPDTARAIARSAGIDEHRVLLGPVLDQMDDAALAQELRVACVVARAVPAHKLRIVRSLQSQGAVVGMTGDGVNDAPALKAADVGIAMGTRGTEVAREAASLVLVDDDFGAIVDAIRGGRRIYDNLQKAFGYIVAVHIPIAALSLVPALLGWASVVLPVHVVFLELLIDPACSIVFETEPGEPNLMERPPRSRDSSVLGPRRILWNALLGFVSSAGTLWALAMSRQGEHPVEVQRAVVFAALLVGNVAILVVSRSTTKPFWESLRVENRALSILALGAAAVAFLVLGVPGVRGFFGFQVDAATDLLRAAIAAAVPVFAVDASKAFRNGRR